MGTIVSSEKKAWKIYFTMSVGCATSMLVDAHVTVLAPCETAARETFRKTLRIGNATVTPEQADNIMIKKIKLVL